MPHFFVGFKLTIMNGENVQMGYCAHEINLEVHILVAANNCGKQEILSQPT